MAKPVVRICTGAILCLMLAGAFAVAANAPARLSPGGNHTGEPDGHVEFGRHVRPILVRHCLACHGFDPSTREADLRLDTFESATAPRADGAAIVPGDPDASLLMRRVSAHDPDNRMPPEGPGLEAEEIATLRAWIEQGASYEPHWSLRPLGPVEPPEVGDAAWSAHPIDRFIRDGIDAAGLEPAPQADRRTLLRRLSFGLTGLPPTPAQTRTFLADTEPGAIDRLTDRLLDSPRFGEHWARHWLDLMRYAETHAHEFDYPIRHAYQYRDYVIRAFNADVRYDTFVTEHIAGDLMPEPRRHPDRLFNESIIGTGFWWLSQGTHSPVDVVQDEAERLDNQVDVFSKTFLATTVSCARCHDHKFDPVLTREYYGLAAFVQSSRRQEAYLDPDGDIAQAADRMCESDRGFRGMVESGAWPPAEAETGQMAGLLLALGQVLHGQPSGDEEPPAVRTRLLAGFDDGTYDGWQVRGDAFTDTPTPSGTDALAGEGTTLGAGFANTHRRLAGEGSVDADLRTGSLTSEPFRVDRRWLHFRIGGGRHKGKTGLRVMVAGETVAEATGNNSLRLESARFDLSAHRGAEATIEIFDEVTGGWGNIRVDHIVLSDDASIDTPARRDIDVVAEEHGVSRERLGALVEAVQLAGDDIPRALSAWLTACRETGAQDDAVVSVPIVHESGEVSAGTLFDFTAHDRDEFANWFVSGWAFGDGVAERGAFRGGAGRLGVADVRSADSGVLSETLQGTMRSPTFEIAQPYLAVRAQGRGTLRVIIHGYTLDEYNALLWNRVKLDIDSADWSWHVHDLRKWVGLRAHYEIIDDRNDAAVRVSRGEWMAEDRAPGTSSQGQPGAADDDLTLAALAQRSAQSLETALRGQSHDPEACRLASWFMVSGLVPVEPRELLDRLAEIESNCPAPMRVMAMEDGTGTDGYVYVRGDHRQHGEPAPRMFLSALSASPEIETGRGSGRLELARKLFEPSNPLTSRVIVNRVWHHLMGKGLVETTDDFGLLGAAPANQALLDHLSWRFRNEMGWSIKALIREIVSSNTYRAAALPRDEVSMRVDPLNALMSARQPQRLSGEALRDAILTASGDLDTAMFGPSVPVHLTPFMTGRGRPGSSGPLDGHRRRSIYLEVRRNFLNPMMLTFDAPNPHQTMGKRSRSNVPAQSLILMNDPFVVEQAGRMAARVIEAHSDVEPRVVDIYERALAREPTPAETAAAIDFLERQAAAAGLASWRDDQKVWADLCHVVFSLKEFVFIE